MREHTITWGEERGRPVQRNTERRCRVTRVTHTSIERATRPVHGRRLRWLHLGCIALLPLVSACANDSKDTSQTAKVTQGITHSTVTLRYPAGSLGNVPLVALNGALTVADRADIDHPDGTPAGATQLGAAQVEVGAQASIGTLRTQGNVFLRSNSVVSGNVSTAGTVTTQQGATVTGTTQTGVATTPHNEETFEIPVASNPGQPVSLEPDQIRTLAPGSYGSLNVKSRARLKMSAGDYAFTNGFVEPQAVLEINDATGPVRLFFDQGFTFRGIVQALGGAHPALLVVAKGSSGAVIDAPFMGTVMAPAGHLVLGPGEQPHQGSFFGKSIEVRAGTKIVYRPYFRLEGVEVFEVPSPPTGPLGNPVFDAGGGFLTATADGILAVTSSGATTQVYGSANRNTFTLDPAAARFGVYLPDLVEVYGAAGNLITSLAREPAGFAKLIPGTDLVYLPEVGDDPERPRVSRARFFSAAGLQSSFSVSAVQVTRFTDNRMFYSTGSEFVRSNFIGTESFRLPLALVRFEVSKNGRLAAGVIKQPSGEVLVIIDTETGSVLHTRPMASPVWNIAIAPSGRYVAVNTKTRVYTFDRGQALREVELPVEWCVSLDVNDDGVTAAGTQMLSHASRVYLLGTAGTGAWSEDRSVETSGFRPSPTFTPAGDRFILNENSRLTMFAVQRTR
jgi:hypothetical protein